MSIAESVRKPWVIFGFIGVLAFAGWSVWSTTSVVDARNERRIQAQEGRAYLCEKVNELPGKLADLVELAERRRQLLGPTTTIAPPPLRPEQLQELARINEAMQRLTVDLGSPIDCQVAATGTTTTIRRTP